VPYSKNSVRQEILPQQPQERPCRRWHFGPGFSFPAVTKKQKSLDTARFQLNWRCGCRLQAIHAVHASMPGPALSDSPKMKILSFRVLKLTANCSPIAGAHAAHAAMSAVGAITVRPCTTTPGPQSDYHQIQIPLLLLRSHPSQLQTAGARYCIPWRTLTGLHLPCGPAQRLKPCSWRRCMGMPLTTQDHKPALIFQFTPGLSALQGQHAAHAGAPRSGAFRRAALHRGRRPPTGGTAGSVPLRAAAGAAGQRRDWGMHRGAGFRAPHLDRRGVAADSIGMCLGCVWCFHTICPAQALVLVDDQDQTHSPLVQSCSSTLACTCFWALLQWPD